MSKHLFLIIGAGAGVIASVVLAFKAGRRCDEILEKLDEEDAGFFKKAAAVTKEAAPAICAVAATGGALVASYTGREYEFNKAKREIRKLSETKDMAIDSFNRYRDTLKKIDGKEKDEDVIVKLTEPALLPDGSDGEIIHHWQLDDWLHGSELRFDATMRQVMEGMAVVNKTLVAGYMDDQGYVKHGGQPVISDFLIAIDHPELCTRETDTAGWNIEAAEKVCGRFWIDYTIVRSIVDSEEVVYSIDLDMLPYYDVEETVAELEAAGDI